MNNNDPTYQDVRRDLIAAILMAANIVRYGSGEDDKEKTAVQYADRLIAELDKGRT